MNTTPAALFTITGIAKRFGVTPRQADIAVRSRSIPSGRIGIVRVWQTSDFPIIEEALRQTGAIAAPEPAVA